VETREEPGTVIKMLGPLVREAGAKILIIDNLAYLQKYQIPREAAVVMSELRRLRDDLGISILVTLNKKRAMLRREITAQDILCSAVITAGADSVFAIGRSGSQSNIRYIKQVVAGSQAVTFGEAYLPYFRIAVRDENFPAFEHIGYECEKAALANDDGHWEWGRLRKIKQLRDDGLTIREIAGQMGMSRSAVHRRLKIAEAVSTAENRVSTHQNGVSGAHNGVSVVENGVPVRHFYMFDKCVVERCYGCGMCRGRAGHNRSSSRVNIYGHDDCPDDCDLCGPRYPPEVEPEFEEMKRRSDEFYEQLRGWLLAGKSYERPKYQGERRYGVERTGWYPGSENWTEEQVHIFDRWLRTKWQTHEPQPEFSLRE
jgi:AraC-like DNA-binding protein